MSVYDVLLIGGSKVGKTALTKRYLWDFWKETYSPSFIKLYLESNINLYSKSNVVDGKANTVRVLIIDDSSRKPSWFTNYGMVICVYDITDEASFIHVQHLLHDLRTSLGTTKFTLVGNKADLLEGRQVSPEEGQELANRYGAAFLETSAKDDMNVRQAFANEADVSILVKKDGMNVRQAFANEADVSILVKCWYCMTAWMCCVGR